MNPCKMVGPVVLVALSLLPAPANAGQRSRGHGASGSQSAPRPSVPRSYSSPRTVESSRSFVVPRGVPSRSFSRPYYAFRPRFSVGFGLYVGYPVAFPYYGYAYSYPYRYGYAYPYPYQYDPYYYPYSPYPYPYSYAAPAYSYPSYPASANPYPSTYPNYPAQAPPAQGSIAVAPGSGQQDLGGISFSITPGDAQVYVDGQYVGVASTFSATSQPLTLTPGRHHVEIRAVGYQMMTFDTDVTPGQVTPYQGTMQR